MNRGDRINPEEQPTNTLHYITGVTKNLCLVQRVSVPPTCRSASVRTRAGVLPHDLRHCSQLLYHCSQLLSLWGGERVAYWIGEEAMIVWVEATQRIATTVLVPGPVLTNCPIMINSPHHLLQMGHIETECPMAFVRYLAPSAPKNGISYELVQVRSFFLVQEGDPPMEGSDDGLKSQAPNLFALQQPSVHQAHPHPSNQSPHPPRNPHQQSLYNHNNHCRARRITCSALPGMNMRRNGVIQIIAS